MKKLTSLIFLILILLISFGCKDTTEFPAFPRYEFSTDELSVKEFDELIITYPSYMSVLLESEKLTYDSEGDLEIEYYDGEKDEYSWLSLLTAKVGEDVRVSDVTAVDLKLTALDFEEPMILTSMEYFTIDGKEMFLARFDMTDEYYDEYGTEYWMSGIYDYDTSSLYSINVQCDAGMCMNDCLAILSHIDFKM
ncbi:MAG: hypothetical protein IKM61_03840 [Eubacteriaceae bacterium]|nr:hypothetical protein [Eubacteriaceae bacterium]